MTTLAADRNTARIQGDLRSGGAAAALIYGGALVMRNAAGYVTKGAAATGAVGCGRAEERVDNSGGSAGDLDIRYRPGIFRFANSASTDEIGIGEIGKVCYVVDDQTVAKTSGSGARSPAGFVAGVDSIGVWVDMDEGRTNAWLMARKKAVQLRLATIAGSGSPVYRAVSPFSGLVTKITSIIELALTTADATLTAKIGATAITGGVITVTQSGSAAGDIDTAMPTALNYVTAGDMLSIAVTGTQDAAAPANIVFEIDAD